MEICGQETELFQKIKEFKIEMENFSKIFWRNNLTVVNSLSLCEGAITRRRMKNGILEESILDFFLLYSIKFYLT